MNDSLWPQSSDEVAALRAARRDILGFLGRLDHLATPERTDWLAGLNAAIERRILLLMAESAPRDVRLDR